MKYSLEDVIQIKSSCDEDILSTLIDDDIKRYLFIVEYKFKEKKGHRSKYNNPKPISFCDIRIALNKLSNKKFDIQFKYIISTLYLLPADDKPIIFQDIFIHLSQNSFMNDPYSKLAATLIELFDEFNTLFSDNVDEHFTNYQQFNFPALSSYDEICDQNKKKDNIKSQFVFLLSTLIKRKEFEKVNKCIISMQTFITDNIFNVEKKETLEFISNIYKLLAIQCIKDLFELADTIKTHIDFILEKKTNKDINRKIIFNHMDVFDAYNKVSKHTTG